MLPSHLPMLQERSGSPKFLMLLSLHATLFDPGVPWNLTLSISSVPASSTLKPSPTLFVPNEAVLLWGGTSPLRPIVFPVYASPVLFDSFFFGCLRNKRNTRYGLLVRLCPSWDFPLFCGSPYKKHQASLGALTPA